MKDKRGLVVYPFPLDEGATLAEVRVPADVTVLEIERLCAFLRLLPIPDPPSIEKVDA
jgi:hypothetical protein